MKKRITLQAYFLMLLFPVYAQSYLPAAPGSMDKYTVFNFSQNWDFTVTDPQVFQTLPNMIIRGWVNWDHYGLKASDYDFSVISSYHQSNVSFISGITTGVYFYDITGDSAIFKDMVTHDATNTIVPHSGIAPEAYRGNIANPAYRDYIVGLAEIQIDGGTDGIFFDEVISGYDGVTYNGNEGFDDYTIKDFNAYLAAKYPSYAKSDWINVFGMTDTNYINTAQPLNDLNNNFNYREYLAVHGWQTNPCTSSNPLAAEWGRTTDNRADTTSNTFLAKYTTQYWRDIVSRTRQYARDNHGKEILITSNGLFPYVDFHSLGMYNYNFDMNGAEAPYVPASSGHLNGSFSLQAIYKSLYQRGHALAGQAPVVLFIDWPTQMLTDYYNFSLNEKQDYWKIYGAEAYANGIFPTFHLRTSMVPADPTAESQGMLGFLTDYPAFYKQNASLYHHNLMLTSSVTVSATGINASTMLHPDSSRYSIHLVNHNYVTGTGMTKIGAFTVSLSLDSVPMSVYVKSPDFSGYRVLNSNYSGNTLTISVDSLYYYDVIVLDYVNAVTGINDPVKTIAIDITIFPNPSTGSVTIRPCSDCNFSKATISIYDEMGRSISDLVLDKSPANFNLNQGVYYIKWNNSNGHGVKKLVIF